MNSGTLTRVGGQRLTPCLRLDVKESMKLFLHLVAFVSVAASATETVENPPAKTISGFRMIWCEPGEALIGSSTSERNRDNQEFEPTLVDIEGFWIGETEVTQGEWAEVFGRDFSEFIDNKPIGESNFVSKDLPVYAVPYEFVEQFFGLLNETEAANSADDLEFRLPTEAEWQYACTKNDPRPFHCGDTLTGTDANFYSFAPYPWGIGAITEYLVTPLSRPVQPRRFAPNARGIFDMHGNVGECTLQIELSQTVSKTGLKASRVTRVWDPSVSLVAKGGSWGLSGDCCRAGARIFCDPRKNLMATGLRIVFGKKLDALISRERNE